MTLRNRFPPTARKEVGCGVARNGGFALELRHVEWAQVSLKVFLPTKAKRLRDNKCTIQKEQLRKANKGSLLWRF